MNITLDQILGLVGKLDDSPGEKTPSKRFRAFLRENVKEIAQVRDYIEECLGSKGDQYSCALQDLINYVGEFLGFSVEYGRYRGVQGEIGFDGHWTSPSGFHIVVEVKATEAYLIKPATLVGYIDHLISEKRVPNWDIVMGMYILGRPGREIQQLANNIVAETRTDQLRIISSSSLVSLAEIMSEYDITHAEILEVLRPSGPSIDRVADLMARIVAQRENKMPEPSAPTETISDEPGKENAPDSYWFTPIASDDEETSEERIRKLVGESKMYTFGEKTPGRKLVKPGDWIAFYAGGKGIIAHARVASAPQRSPHPKVRHGDQYPWTFRLDDPRLYLDDPVIIDVAMRTKLDAFKGRDENRP